MPRPASPPLRSFLRSCAQAARAPRRAAAVLCIAAAALAACSPQYDWRTLHDDAGYTVDLPAKPTVDTHAVDIAGTPMQMRMQAAHMPGAVFAVGTVTLPDARDATQRAVLDYLKRGLARNLGAAPQTKAVRVPLSAGGAADGVELRVAGEAAHGQSEPSARRPKQIVAWLVARERHVYQIVVISDTPMSPDTLDQFFGSLKLD